MVGEMEYDVYMTLGCTSQLSINNLPEYNDVMFDVMFECVLVETGDTEID